MAGEENLIPFNKMTEEQQRAIASKGGKISQERKKERKKLKESLLILLEEGENQDSLVVSLFNKALAGDIKAFEVIRDTIGEKPVDKQEFVGDSAPQILVKFVGSKDETDSSRDTRDICATDNK